MSVPPIRQPALELIEHIVLRRCLDPPVPQRPLGLAEATPARSLAADKAATILRLDRL